MHVIIPVAGEGTRLRPHTYSIPKVLLPVAGKPIISHIIDEVVKLSPEKVTLIIGHLGERIKAFLEGTYDLPFRWVVQSERKGLGHAVGMGIDEGEREPLLIILGDTIFEADLSGLSGGDTSFIGVKEVDDPRRFGVVELEGDLVVKLVEKPDVPPSNLAIVGLYYIRNARELSEAVRKLVSEDIRSKGEYQLTDALQLLVDGGEPLKTFRVEGWYDCGKQETLLATNSHFLSKLSGKIQNKDSLIIDPVFLSPEAEVSRSVIGPDVSVSEGVSIRQSIIKNSIVCDRAQVRNIILEDSIIGPGAVIEGSFSRLNLGEESRVRVE
ncbi:MAG: sugar phosphate nucleotidyltransferase [Candidatus Glassbacteria bacterium]